MKNLKLAVIIFISTLFFSCAKDELDNFEYGISPITQESLLCKSLRINGNNLSGTIPSKLGNFNNLIITQTAQKVEISAGVLLYIPYKVSNINSICKVYIQVEGADNFWETKLLKDPASGNPYFEILIPRFVHDGQFKFVYSLGDCSGNVSQIYSTITIVSPQGNCNSIFKGTVGITIRSLDLGDKKGIAKINFEAFNIPDRLDIKYNGDWVSSTGTLLDKLVVVPDCNSSNNGFVSGRRILTFNYDPKVSRFVEIFVSGCNSGTAWELYPECP